MPLYLLLQIFKVPLTRNPKVAPRYNIKLLQDPPSLRAFQIALNNRYQVLADLADEEQQQSIEDVWNERKQAWTDTSKEILGLKQNQHKEWITTETLSKIENRRKLKDKISNSRTRAGRREAQKQYNKANREVRGAIKHDKREFINNLAKEAEIAANQHRMKDLYELTRKLAGKKSSTPKPIKDKHGNTLTKQEDQLKRWGEYFEELLNRPPPRGSIPIPEAELMLDVNTEKPSKEEIAKVIQKLKNGKAPGPDGIPAEILKADLNTSTQMLYEIFEKIWEEETIPEDWKEGYLVKVPKKGDLANCNNYRGITMLSVPGKILSRIILQRLIAALEEILRDQQMGFRKNRSCTDHIATLRIIAEQSIEWNSSLYITFIDFEKAFDSVDHNTLWKILRHYGIPEKFIAIIQQSYYNSQIRVIHNHEITPPFSVQTGVRQGCILSPMLFLLVIDWIMKTTTEGARTGLQWTLLSQLHDLDFADDIALLSHNHRHAQDKVHSLATIAAMAGLNIKKSKTKTMRINSINEAPIKLDNEDIENVASFTYLGSVIAVDGGTERDVLVRIGKARTAFLLLRPVWRSKEISLRTKLRIFNSNVKTVLMYGAETWRVTKNITDKTQAFVNRCLRYILGVRWPNTISNEDLWAKTQEDRMMVQIRRKKWKWIGHTLRKPHSSVTKQALFWNPQGKRNRGRPRNNWRRSAEQELRQIGLRWTQIEHQAQDREQWKSTVNELCST